MCIFALKFSIQTMKRPFLILFLLALLMPSSADAQRRRKVVKEPEPTEDPRIQQMLASMQQVVFIDSLVVPRQNFVSHIPLSEECGRLTDPDGLGCHTNELGDHRLLTMAANDTVSHLFSSDLIGGEWTTPAKAEGISDAAANYPYLLPDGTTLYFAQKGTQSLGGFDLFVTRYDAEEGSFLRAENLGMPFASEADDLLYVIDETYQLGYFVTNRHQPTGQVCIYVFIPSKTRRTYPTEAFSEQQLRSFASIGRIADTWSLVTQDERQQAMQRLALARQDALRPDIDGQSNTTNDDNELSDLRAQATILEQTLDNTRRFYARASTEERQRLRDEILSAERELEQLQTEIRQIEKQLRNQQYQNNN